MGIIRVSDLEFKILESGSRGPLMLLLHGYGSGPLEWHGVLPHLSSRSRVVIPNLMPLFSGAKPISFSRQVMALAQLINQINIRRESFVVVGSSFGGTLSYGLRAHFRGQVESHIMINPMPLDPLNHLKDLGLRVLLGMNMVPGALPLFLGSKLGRQQIEELGLVFGFGIGGKRRLSGLSHRKLELVSRAVQRFAWIAHHEDWAFWQNQLRDNMVPTLIVTGQRDPLFNEGDFRRYQTLLPMSEHRSIDDGDHLLIKSHGGLLADWISRFACDTSLFEKDLVQQESWRRAN